MIGEFRRRVVLFGAVVLTLAVCLPGAPLPNAEYAAAVLLLAVCAGVAVVALHVRTLPAARIRATGFGVRQGWSRRLFCPVVTPRDPACPRAPGIG